MTDFKTRNVDIKKMSKETGFNAEYIRLVLDGGMPKPKSKSQKKSVPKGPIKIPSTIEGIHDAFAELEYGERKKRKMLQAEWIKLSLEEIGRASTFEEALRASKRTPNSDSKIKALTKCIKFSSNIDEVIKIYQIHSAIENWTISDKESKKNCYKTILEKWNKFSFEMIEKASSVEEVKIAYGKTPYRGIAKKAALKKWCKLSIEMIKNISTSKEARLAYNNSPSESNAQKAILKKWNEVARKEADEASSSEDAEKVYLNTPHSITTRSYILKKFNEKMVSELSEISTSEGIWEIYLRLRYPNMKTVREKALRKFVKLSIEKIKGTNTLEEAVQIYQQIPLEAKTERLCVATIKKLASFFLKKRKG